MQSLLKKTSRAASGTLLLAAALATGACGLLPQKTEVAPGVTQQTGQFEFALPSGEYRCERGERLQLQREVANAVNNRIQLSWNGGQYQPVVLGPAALRGRREWPGVDRSAVEGPAAGRPHAEAAGQRVPRDLRASG